MALTAVQAVSSPWQAPCPQRPVRAALPQHCCALPWPALKLPPTRPSGPPHLAHAGPDQGTLRSHWGRAALRDELPGGARPVGRLPAVAGTRAGWAVEQVEEGDIANRNPYLEGDFEIGDDEEWEEVPLHRVKIHDSAAGRTFEVDVPEDRYILHSAEEQGHTLPFACRMGCCTACAVRVKAGKLYQPLALGISNELKAQGYALLCVAYPLSDVEVETQDEDEVYYLQFGKYFARGPIERDDIALEIALQDE
ncbi:Ferredoxin [Klebsormidium nitens]|uniref:Ferredoxin n=1 Tax=Klebsormidium nitens TaxID=105231 RepID=A0A1Y1IPS7_KLENI|nr:Ferredoxin [Klebsormidium nitens]|eukprot:GAQ90148.1 Ferredoxin [Klebsormidium nitens]